MWSLIKTLSLSSLYLLVVYGMPPSAEFQPEVEFWASRFAASSLESDAPIECNTASSLSATWTTILRPTSLNSTHIDDAITIVPVTDDKSGLSWTATCNNNTRTNHRCSFKTANGIFLDEGTVQVEFDGKGEKSRKVGTIGSPDGNQHKCDCITWEDDTAWAHTTSLSCGASSKIKKVHIVWMNHLDVGFNMAGQGFGNDNGFIASVINRYTGVYFPLAIKLANEMRKEFPNSNGDRFVYTTHPWLVNLYLECPKYITLANGSHLTCPSKKEIDAFTDAVKQGDITWHHGPFNLQNENVGPANLFEDSLLIADELDKRFGINDRMNTNSANLKTFNLRDVPGSTRAVVPLLVKHGFGAITVGQNSGTPSTGGWGLHKLYRWRDELSGTELIGMNHAGGYPNDPGNTVEQCGGICREDCMMAPGIPEALCFAFRTDNSGPPPTTEAIGSVFSILRKEFPSALVQSSTISNFLQGVLPHKEHLEVIYSEIGDTWIQGVQSDPWKMSQYREIVRTQQECISQGICSNMDAEIRNSTRFLLAVPEHTWGLPGSNDTANWLNKDFDKAYNHDTHLPTPKNPLFNYADLNKGWKEHRSFNDFALDALKHHHSNIFEKINKNLASLRRTSAPTRTYLQSLGYQRVHKPNFSNDIVCDFGSNNTTTLKFDPSTGGLVRLQLGNLEWASPRNVIGIMEYSTFNETDYQEMNAVYHGPEGNGCGFSKGGLTKYAPNIGRNRFKAAMQSLFLRKNSTSCSIVYQMSFPKEAVTDFGGPSDVWVTIDSRNFGQLNFDVAVFNKTRTRIPEAMHWSFYPMTPQMKYKSKAEIRRRELYENILLKDLNDDKFLSLPAYNWTMDKLGQRISPFETMVNGNPLQHAVWQGVFFEPSSNMSNQHSKKVLQFESLDAAVVSPSTAQTGEPTPYIKMLDRLRGPILGMGFNLWNNIWNVNYPTYYPYLPNGSGDENIVYRFKLSVH